MNKQYNVAVVGATGAVGQKIVQFLEEKPFEVNNIKLLSSKRSAGKKMLFNGEEVTVEEATPESFQGVDIAFFSAGGAVSKKLAKEAVKEERSSSIIRAHFVWMKTCHSSFLK